jgi:RNA-directed DNA polymerase
VISPLLANIALNGIESLHEYKLGGKIVKPSVRYADDMVIILRPEDDATIILAEIDKFLAQRGMKISEKKTKITAATDGFDFLGWHFKVQSNGKFRSTPSVDNFKKFRQKVKAIINCSNYGSKVKAQKLAPVVRVWRNYHRFCDMSGSRFSLWFLNERARMVFNKETRNDSESSSKLVKQAFPTVPCSQNSYVKVKGNKSPYDGDLLYWSQRNSKLYSGSTSKALQKQNHSCGHCGLRFIGDELVHLHHIDGNHDNWKPKNLQAVHESCHDYLHMGKSAS